MAFSEDTVKRAFGRAKGQCECWRKTCGHDGRCKASFTYSQRSTSGNDKGWQANHVLSSGPGGGGDGLENCEILCVPCHKNTRSYGAH